MSRDDASRVSGGQRGMDAPVAEVLHGTRAALREFAAELLGMACIQAELGERFATLGDDVGLRYAVRRLAAYVQAAAQTVHDLSIAARD